MEPDHEAYIAYRKGSVGSVVPPTNLSVPSGLKPGSKSNSMGSISGDLDGGLEREDIVSLTHDVRSFSDALANLKNVFNGDPGEDGKLDLFFADVMVLFPVWFLLIVYVRTHQAYYRIALNKYSLCADRQSGGTREPR